jgi:hypothetical protein
LQTSSTARCISLALSVPPTSAAKRDGDHCRVRLHVPCLCYGEYLRHWSQRSTPSVDTSPYPFTHPSMDT